MRRPPRCTRRCPRTFATGRCGRRWTGPPGRPRRRRRPREGGAVMAVRKLYFPVNLRRLLAAREMGKTTELVPLLRQRDVELSASQVYRLVTDKPERLSMKVLIALCDILDCTPADLIDPYAEPAA